MHVVLYKFMYKLHKRPGSFFYTFQCVFDIVYRKATLTISGACSCVRWGCTYFGCQDSTYCTSSFHILRLYVTFSKSCSIFFGRYFIHIQVPVCGMKPAVLCTIFILRMIILSKSAVMVVKKNREDNFFLVSQLSVFFLSSACHEYFFF